MGACWLFTMGEIIGEAERFNTEAIPSRDFRESFMMTQNMISR